MNHLKNSFLALFLLLCAANGMENVATIPVRLQNADGTYDEQLWTQPDFDKIPVFRNILEDINLDTLTFPIENRRYLTHEYLHDLIRGKFPAGRIKQYINDYNYFIGHDLKLDKESKYEPFKTSLTWKVFQKHKKFFYANIDSDPIVRNFLYCDLSKQSTFEKEDIIITKSTGIGLPHCTDNATKLSIQHPYIIDYRNIFEQNEFVRWLEFNDCIIENLELKTLFEYFPNLHMLIMKNCYVKSMTDADFQILLTGVKPQEVQNLASEESIANLPIEIKEAITKTFGPNPTIKQCAIVLEFAGLSVSNQDDRAIAEEKLFFGYCEDRYSFDIGFEGSWIVNIPHFMAQNQIPPGNKPIFIKDIDWKKLFYQRICYYTRDIIIFAIPLIVNAFLIKKASSFCMQSEKPTIPILLLIAHIMISCVATWATLKTFYEELISKPIVLR